MDRKTLLTDDENHRDKDKEAEPSQDQTGHSVSKAHGLYVDIPPINPETLTSLFIRHLEQLTAQQWRQLAAGTVDCEMRFLLTDMVMDLVQLISEDILDAVLHVVYKYIRIYGNISQYSAEASKMVTDYFGMTEDRLHARISDALQQSLGSVLLADQSSGESLELTQLVVREVANSINSVVSLALETPILESKVPVLFVSGCISSTTVLQDMVVCIATVMKRGLTKIKGCCTLAMTTQKKSEETGTVISEESSEHKETLINTSSSSTTVDEEEQELIDQTQDIITKVIVCAQSSFTLENSLSVTSACDESVAISATPLHSSSQSECTILDGVVFLVEVLAESEPLSHDGLILNSQDRLRLETVMDMIETVAAPLEPEYLEKLTSEPFLTMATAVVSGILRSRGSISDVMTGSATGGRGVSAVSPSTSLCIDAVASDVVNGIFQDLQSYNQITRETVTSRPDMAKKGNDNVGGQLFPFTTSLFNSVLTKLKAFFALQKPCAPTGDVDSSTSQEIHFSDGHRHRASFIRFVKAYISQMLEDLKKKVQMPHSDCKRASPNGSHTCIIVGSKSHEIVIEDIANHNESHRPLSAMSSRSNMSTGSQSSSKNSARGATPDTLICQSPLESHCPVSRTTVIDNTKHDSHHLRHDKMQVINAIADSLVEKKPEDGKQGRCTDRGLTSHKRKENLISSEEFHKDAKDLTDKIFDLVWRGKDYQIPTVPAGKSVSDTIVFQDKRKAKASEPGLPSDVLYMMTEESVRRLLQQVDFWLTLNPQGSDHHQTACSNRSTQDTSMGTDVQERGSKAPRSSSELSDDTDFQKLHKAVYKDLQQDFGSVKMLKAAMASQDPAFDPAVIKTVTEQLMMATSPKAESPKAERERSTTKPLSLRQRFKNFFTKSKNSKKAHGNKVTNINALTCVQEKPASDSEAGTSGQDALETDHTERGSFSLPSDKEPRKRALISRVFSSMARTMAKPFSDCFNNRS